MLAPWNSRSRFLETMRGGTPDRVPYFEEGLREETLSAWHAQEFPRAARIETLFPCDRREEPEISLDPTPQPERWPSSLRELDDLRARLNPHDPGRLPDDWKVHVDAGPERDYVLMLEIHQGFFLSMGVYDWSRFSEVMFLMRDDPEFVHACMALQGEFSARLLERLLDQVEPDAVVFSEPIGGNDRPLISPQDYEEFALRHYAPIQQVIRDCGVQTIIFRTYANSRILMPSVLRHGFNCLWACETNIQAMDYRELRREFGRDLRLIGGIDLDALRSGTDAIRREILEKVPPLLEQGGYVPLADGRIREDVPLANYLYYRELLAKVTQSD